MNSVITSSPGSSADIRTPVANIIPAAIPNQKTRSVIILFSLQARGERVAQAQLKPLSEKVVRCILSPSRPVLVKK
jgi:hypothetical protein